MSKISYKFVELSAAKTPVVTVDRKSEIVLYGEDNRFPNFILDLSIQSSLHSAILDKKIKMLCGEGFIFDDKKSEQFIKSPNPYESLNDILLKIATDLEVFGGFALQVIWAKNKKNIAEIYHCPFQNIRSGKLNEKNIVEEYFYTEDWSRYTRVTDTKRFKSFLATNDRSGTQIFYCKKYTPTNLYYPVPSYIGGLKDINTLQQISEYHNAAISNNFQPGIIIVFRGPKPTEEEQDDIVKRLQEKYKGAKNAGTPSIFFLDTDQEPPQIFQTSVSELDKQYSTLTESIKESVVMAHSIPRIIAGLEKPGSLGGGKEYIDANEIFMKTYVIKNQNFIIENLKKILSINGIENIKIKNQNTSLLLFDNSLLKDVLTKNEIRYIFGYEPLDDTEKNNLENNE